jgi:hypothetical protein
MLSVPLPRYRSSFTIVAPPRLLVITYGNEIVLCFQRVRRTCRRMAFRLNCIRSLDVVQDEPASNVPPVSRVGEGSSSRADRGKQRAEIPAQDDDDDNDNDVAQYLDDSMWQQVDTFEFSYR